MKRKIITVITVLLFSILFPIIAYSHPGRTDASGGHWDRSNGTYHYHNGGSSSNSGGSGSYSYDYETTKKLYTVISVFVWTGRIWRIFFACCAKAHIEYWKCGGHCHLCLRHTLCAIYAGCA
jgi:hypothetical protein